ncbi:MAG: HU family DNA-binding protein [Bacteroidaceae bacterium]
MNERITIQNLVDLLASKQDINKSDAEKLLKAMFALIEKALQDDKYIKIKGLGTFKITKVDSRDSVSINTGERIKIEGHSKILFLPDNSIREAINKPFAHFETVVLNNDATLLDEIAIDENEDEAEYIEIEETEKKEAETKDIEKKKKDSTKSSGLPYFITIISLVVLLTSGTIFLFFKPNLFKTETPTPPIEKSIIAKKTIKPIKSAIPQADIDTTQTIITGINKDSHNFKPDSTNYVIIGTMTTHKLQIGETLTSISKYYYKTKELWPYIVKHNRDIIKNPNRIPIGAMLRIPALRNR